MGIQQTRIQVNGINIQCYEAGSGPETIVLLHGAGVDSAMMSWSEVMELLSAHYRVIAPDLPGYGRSDRIDEEYSLAFYTDIVIGILEKLNTGPVVLSGLSLGGGISLNLALQHPEFIRLLIPVDAWGLFRKLPGHRLTYWYTRSKLNDNLYRLTGKYRSFVRWSLEQQLIGDKRKVTEELVDEVQKQMLEPLAGQPFISFQRSEINRKGLNTDLFGRLSEITVPTLLIHGSKDRAVPVKDAIAASRIIPNCQLHIMEGCKHWPQKERPDEYVRVVSQFITNHPA